MLITTPQKRLHLQNSILHLTYNNDVLKNVKNDKVLGVHIDNNLTWTVHTEFIAEKISSNLWLLSKLKEYLSTECNFIRLTYNLTLTIAQQFGVEHLTPI